MAGDIAWIVRVAALLPGHSLGSHRKGASGVIERFGVRVDPPQDQPWGLRDFPLMDPTGVLWRVAQEISA